MPSVTGFDPDAERRADFDDSGDRPAAKVTCRHCMVWAEVRAGEFAVVCGHGCGRVANSWISTDPQREARLAEESQQAFQAAHARGCPHALRGARYQGSDSATKKRRLR